MANIMKISALVAMAVLCLTSVATLDQGEVSQIAKDVKQLYGDLDMIEQDFMDPALHRVLATYEIKHAGGLAGETCQNLVKNADKIQKGQCWRKVLGYETDYDSIIFKTNAKELLAVYYVCKIAMMAQQTGYNLVAE